MIGEFIGTPIGKRIGNPIGWDAPSIKGESFALFYGKQINPLLPFTRSSVAWAYDENGIYKSFPINIPRVSYDTLGEFMGLLIEEQRTNKIPAYTANPTVLADITTIISALQIVTGKHEEY